jgi:hypothetical protein
MSTLKGDERPYGDKFTGRFFYNKLRVSVNLSPEWLKMFNECKNTRGQTPLYVMLRFGANESLIYNLFLDFPSKIDVNRQNNDGSTPLLGLFYGLGQDSPINFERVSFICNKLLYNGGNLNIPNLNGETALNWLLYKNANGLITYSDEAKYNAWISTFYQQS